MQAPSSNIAMENPRMNVHYPQGWDLQQWNAKNALQGFCYIAMEMYLSSNPEKRIQEWCGYLHLPPKQYHI